MPSLTQVVETDGAKLDPELPNRIRERIRAAGPVTFAAFMESALYDEEGGFYSRPRVGESGDFVTSPHVSAAFGVLVARQLEEFWELLNKPDPFWAVEVGAGDGTLASQVLEFGPAGLQKVIRYAAVERSAPGRRALERLDVLVLQDLEAVPAGGLFGCVLANELLDNLPCHRVRGTERGVAELYVGLTDDRFVLVEGPLSSEALARSVPELHTGEEAVVHPQATEFLDRAAAVLEKGYLWLIDYGFTGGRRAESPHGYRGHRLEEDVLTDPGSRDITVGVDFDALARHASSSGHAVWGPVSQRNALVSLGYRRLEEDARRRQVQLAAEGRPIEANRVYSARGRATMLVDPTGLGGFLTLCVGVGTEVPPTTAGR
jgi:SAM-dependent MidA family methyltransferase